jgi:hypothetical protein
LEVSTTPRSGGHLEVPSSEKSRVFMVGIRVVEVYAVGD